MIAPFCWHNRKFAESLRRDWHTGGARRYFFFEKKKQKTFALWVDLADSSIRARKRIKVFWFFFFKKELLSWRVCSNTGIGVEHLDRRTARQFRRHWVDQTRGEWARVSDGNSSNAARYVAAKRPKSRKPYRRETAVTLVVAGVAESNSLRT
jgi:hypothetical protein